MEILILNVDKEINLLLVIFSTTNNQQILKGMNYNRKNSCANC